MAEGRVPEKTFEHDNSDSPNVNGVVVARLGKHFRGDIIRRAHFGKASLKVIKGLPIAP